MAFIIEGIFISKTVTSLQIKVHECYIKELKPRESLLTIEEEEDEVSEEKLKVSDSEASEASDTEENIEDLVISDKEVTLGFIFNTNFVLKIYQILRTHPWVKFIRITTPFY